MKMYNIDIADIFIDIQNETKETLITNIDKFEEKINEKAPTMMDECYIIVEAVKSGLYDMMVFTHNIDTKTLIDISMKNNQFTKNEAIFIIGIMKKVIDHSSVRVSILNFNEIKDNALSSDSLFKIQMIALAYYEGNGIDQDYEEAYQLFTYLYEQGDTSALSYLGYMLENGLGVERNITKAFELYEKGSLNHDDRCLYHLGLCYLEGKGCLKDKELAKKYLRESKNIESYITLANIYEEEKMLGESFQYYLKAAHEYNVDAMYKVGMAYFNGEGVSKNTLEATKYFIYAAYLSQKDSLYQIGYMMIKGIEFDKDINKGLNYIFKSANLGCVKAYITLAKFYEFGQYLNKDINQSIYYYQKAIEYNQDILLQEKIKRMKENENI